MHTDIKKTLFVSFLLLAVAMLAGCARLPYDRSTETAAAGALAGAAAGAELSEGNDASEAIIGGALGAAAGYAIGEHTDGANDWD